MTIVSSISLDNNIYLIQDDVQSVCTILLGKNYISYCISDEEYKTVFHLNHYYYKNNVVGKSDFDEVLADSKIKNAKKINIGIDSIKSILVPNELYDENEKENYFKYINEITADEIILNQTFNSSIHNLYAVKKSTKQFLESRLKNIQLFNSSACLLINYPDFIIDENEFSIFIAVKDDNATITLYRKKNLLLHQNYPFVDIMDITYYVVNICGQHQIDKKQLGIQLHGEVSQIEELSLQLKKYFYQVRFISRIKDIQYPDTLYAYAPHYFFNLFSIFKCAL